MCIQINTLTISFACPYGRATQALKRSAARVRHLSTQNGALELVRRRCSVESLWTEEVALLR